MLDLLWGLKTVAMFDVWTFEHILAGVSIGQISKNKNRKHIKNLNPNLPYAHKTVIWFEILLVLALAYAWEALEHYLESGLAGNMVEFWFQGVEHWTNRLIADPLMLVVGYYLVKRFPRFIMPARVLSIGWLIVHIFIFPHSMWLHYIV